MNATENLREWLRGCPALSKKNRFGVDFLGKGATEYALYCTPTSMTFKTDVLGNKWYDPIQTLNYIFACKLLYSMDTKANQANYDLFAEVIRWIEQKNIAGDYPEIEEGTVRLIMPTLSPYVYEAGPDSARYQIQLAIKYKRRNA